MWSVHVVHEDLCAAAVYICKACCCVFEAQAWVWCCVCVCVRVLPCECVSPCALCACVEHRDCSSLHQRGHGPHARRHGHPGHSQAVSSAEHVSGLMGLRWLKLGSQDDLTLENKIHVPSSVLGYAMSFAMAIDHRGTQQFEGRISTSREIPTGQTCSPSTPPG